MKKLIAGLDEVGMGCLAGPLVVCVAAFYEGTIRIAGVKDSKKVTPNARKKLMPHIIEEAEYVGFGYADVDMIDCKGISYAWQYAVGMALDRAPKFDLLVVDGTRAVKGYSGKQLVKPKADVVHWEVSAASIIAKVMRDAHMEDLAPYYPDYDFSSNMGYGTDKHRTALEKKGALPIHRKLFLRKLKVLEQ